jgi:cell division protein FtsQ
LSGALVATNNELIRKRRKKRAVRRAIVLTVLLIAILVTLCLKLSYFNVSSIKIINNSIVTSEEIANLAKVNMGTNIFYINISNIKTNVLKNPYIINVEVKRKFPNTITISVNERQAVFYSLQDNKYLIIDKNGIVLEEKEDIDSMNLTSLLGLNFQEARIGEPILTQDNRKINEIGVITELIALNSSGIEITSVDLSDGLNIKVNSRNISIKLGSGNIKDKLNLALNIIENNQLKEQKGYIDVSFEGNPVVYIEKKTLE